VRFVAPASQSLRDFLLDVREELPQLHRRLEVVDAATGATTGHDSAHAALVRDLINGRVALKSTSPGVELQEDRAELERDLAGLRAKVQTTAQSVQEGDKRIESIRRSVERRITASLLAGGTYLFAQTGLLAWMTYDTFGWDVVEPITNQVGMTIGVLAYAFGALFRKEYTYDAAVEVLHGYFVPSKVRILEVEQQQRQERLSLLCPILPTP
jgi:hypothetical protein